MIKEDLPRNKPASSNKKLHITLPIPTSVNAMYTLKRRLTAEARRYITLSTALINEAIEEQRWSMEKKGTWLYIDMMYYFPDLRNRDASNCLKILLDVMQDRVYENDMYALPRIQGVELDRENPRVEIVITLQNERQRKKGEVICSS